VIYFGYSHRHSLAAGRWAPEPSHCAPVVAFYDDTALWLADGFHRWHSRKVLDLDDIEVDVRAGSRRDALLYSLSANSKHGLQRNAMDYRRAYEIAVNNKLVNPVDVEAVVGLLRCLVGGRPH
jgi:hypothetical protein